MNAVSTFYFTYLPIYSFLNILSGCWSIFVVVVNSDLSLVFHAAVLLYYILTCFI